MTLLQHPHVGWFLLYVLVFVTAVLVVIGGIWFIIVRRVKKAKSSKMEP